MFDVPAIRISRRNDQKIRDDGDFVLYWMVAQRRLIDNFALQRACWWAEKLDKPLVIFEPLRCDYPWASERFHRFIIDGMFDHASQLVDTPVTYYPYVEPQLGTGKGLMRALTQQACVVITDDYPCFFLPRMIDAAASKLDLLVEAIDSNGLLPLRAAEKTYTTAYSFRRGLHKMLPAHFSDTPMPAPIDALGVPALPEGTLDELLTTWPAATDALLEQGNTEALADIPLKNDVPAAPLTGGQVAATARLEEFLDNLPAYLTGRNEPGQNATSGLSAYLHFGHIGTHTIFRELTEQEGWSPTDIADKPTGKRSGWWRMSDAAESFIDELVTWREIGFNMAHREPDTYDKYESLPDWARLTLAEHADDEREYTYTLEEFERAQTHDELWNAAQNQLVQEGTIHNYLRMLWGKKIIEWTETPQQALEIMIELNNKWALDGRDPNSYSGIFWVLGRYDRGWTERDIFGKIRYMTSASTRRKYDVSGYIRRYNRSSRQLGLGI